jgi:polyisoprenoid-binding protein YceI
VTLDVEYHGWATDPWGAAGEPASPASAEVDREDFGLTWNAALEGGGVLVGKKAHLEFEIEAVKQD